MMTPGIGDEIRPPKQGAESKLKKVEDKLYSPSAYMSLKPRKELNQQEFQAESNWNDGDLSSMLQDTTPKKPRVNVFMILATIAFIFFAGASSYGILKFMNGNQFAADSNIDLTVSGPISIGGGEELALDIFVQNNNPGRLETVDLVIEYPEGTKQASDLRTDLPRLREGLGTIEPNSVVRKTHSAALFGEEGTSKQIKVRVEYRLAGSNAIFEESKTFDVVLQSSPIRLTVDSVTEITSSQELSFDLSLTSNSSQTLSNVLVKAQYPFGFSFGSATIEPTSGKDSWLFESINPNETKKITLKGQLAGNDGEERVFKFSAGIADEQNKNELGIIFTTLPKGIKISRPFLALNLSIDGDQDPIVAKEADNAINSMLYITNNTSANIQDIEVILSFSGDVLDKTSVEAENGFYKSSNNTIVWNKSLEPKFSEMIVGQTSNLSFHFRNLPLFSNAALFTNPEIVISATVKGIRSSETMVPEEIESTTFKRVRFVTEANVQTDVTHVSGPLPPKVDEESTYAVKLLLDNVSNKLTNGRLTARLPIYAKWLGSVTPSSQKVSYDEKSRSVVWDVGDVEARTGYSLPVKSVSLQIAIEPSVSQVGSVPTLLEDIIFEAFDSFADTTVNVSTDDASAYVSESWDSHNKDAVVN